MDAAIASQDWSSFSASLLRRLTDLADGQWLTLVAPPPPVTAPGEGRGGSRPAGILSRWLRRGPVDPPAPFLQFARYGDEAYAECVGSRSFGGLYPWSPAQEEALLAMGWKVNEVTGTAPVYVPVVFAETTPTAGYASAPLPTYVALAVRTLSEVMAVARPADVQWTAGP